MTTAPDRLQPLDPLTLWHLGREWHDRLTGACVNRVQQPTLQDWVFHFWWACSGQHHDWRGAKLWIHLNRDTPFALLAPGDRFRHLLPDDRRQRPTGLCLLLRKQLGGTRLKKVETLPGEQVLVLHFTGTNELGLSTTPTLVLELMGKHTNLFLLDAWPNGTILGGDHVVTDTMSRLRQLGPGLPYCEPPRPPDKPWVGELPLDTFLQALHAEKALTPRQWVAVLLNRAWGLRRQTLLQWVERYPPATPAALLAGVQALLLPEACQPTLLPHQAGFHLFGATQPGEQAVDSVLALLNEYYLTQLSRHRLEQERQKLGRPLNEERQSVRQAMLTLEADLPEASSPAVAAPPEEEQMGQALLTAHAMRLLPSNPPAGVETYSFDDPITGETRTVGLQPGLDWLQLAQWYFRQSKKYKGRQAYQTQRLETLQTRWQQLDELRVLLDQADNFSDLTALRHDWHEAGLLQLEPMGGKRKTTPGKDSTEETGVLKLHTRSGCPVWVGRSGQGNAKLCGKLAQADDLWFHVQEIPGSHVLLKTHHYPVTEPDLEDAAMLAVYFSQARQSAHVPVVYTQAKHVRKIPGSWPGHVTYTHETGVFITVEDARLDPLLLSSRLGLPKE